MIPSMAHDYVALAGIAGTLLGTALGAFVTWKIQKYQLEHEDRTRFHDRRLTVYADFNDACQQTVGAIQAGLPFDQFQGDVVKTFEMLRLVASPVVFARARDVHGSVGAITDGQPSNRPMLLVSYNAQMVALVNAMRTEIGVDVANQG
jgi:hypothetical protein